MKKSLKESIRLFNFFEQLLIKSGLLCYKLKIKPRSRTATLLEKCTDYVRLIENGVVFEKVDNNTIKATSSINKRKISVFLRPNSSDLHVFDSVLNREEYIIAVDKNLSVSENSDMTIIDAGGNIGLTSIFFYAFYPKAKFVIIEPDQHNFEMLKKNIELNKIKNISLLQKALWVNNEKLEIKDSFRDGREWSLTVDSVDPKNQQDQKKMLEGITLQEICKEKKIVTIDILKIDIEGSERFLFNDDLFLNNIKSKVKRLVMEIHDEFEIRDALNYKMNRLGFSRTEAGELTLYSKEN